MSAPMPKTSIQTFLRVRLMTLFAIVAVVAIGVAWWADHDRLRQEIDRITLEEQILRQKNMLLKEGFLDRQKELFLDRDKPAIVPQQVVWQSPEAFLDAVRKASSQRAALDIAASLKAVNQEEFDASIALVLPLLNDEDSQVRQTVRDVIFWNAKENKHRIQPHAQAILQYLLPVLKDKNSAGIPLHYALVTVREFGADSTAALPALAEISQREKDQFAVVTIIVRGDIDPSFDKIPVLKAIVADQRPGWISAAHELGKELPPGEAEQFLKEIYGRPSTTESLRWTLSQVLLQLEE